MSVWNPENIKDVAESLGIINLSDEATRALASDIEYRLAQVLEEALKFMRHGKRTTLTTQDVSQALRVLGVEPLYGYESTRPLRFGEASIGPGQPLYYVEDEEMEFEKLINAPLPKVPREITFTAHWLAVEGVQPSIPQNPTSVESRNQDLVPKGSNANPHLAALSGSDNVTVKPQVKHILSQELQQYFERVCTALLDESNTEYRIAALASVSSDPGLHQLVPYFVQFIAEKVTHTMKNIFVLTSTMDLVHSMLNNPTLFVDPYVSSLIPPILTCLVGRHIGPVATSDPLVSYPLRQTASSLLKVITTRYGKSSTTLKPRLVRTCLKYFLDPTKSLASHYGAILGLHAIGGKEITRALVVPNLKEYESVVKDALETSKDVNAMDEGGGGGGGGPASISAAPNKKPEADMVVKAILEALLALEEDAMAVMPKKVNGAGVNGGAAGDDTEDGATKAALAEQIGALFAEQVSDLHRPDLVKVILDCF